MSKEFNFTTTDEETNVTINGEKYVVVTPSGKTVIEYKNKGGNRFEIKDGKASAMQIESGADAFLVSKCLYKLTETGRFPVTIEFVLALRPYSIIEKLAEEAKRLGQVAGEETVESIEEQIQVLKNKLESLRAKESDEGN